MEEQKKESKVVKMNPTVKEEDQNSKYTYEQLEEFCIKFQQQNQLLEKQMGEMVEALNFKRFTYLIEIIKCADKFGDVEFIDACRKEIKDFILPKIQPDENNNTKSE